MTKRLKIVISAYACSPYKGSEPGVGWGFVRALAMHHDLWVITEKEKFQTEIEEYLQGNPEFAAHVNFYFIQKKRNRPLRKIWPPSYYWYYRKWHLMAYHKAEQLHSEINFDVAHQLTMVGFREPGYKGFKQYVGCVKRQISTVCSLQSQDGGIRLRRCQEPSAYLNGATILGGLLEAFLKPLS